MVTIERTNIFAEWLRKLRDRQAKAIILNHIDRMEDGNLGKVKPVGGGVYEKKINYCPGYRLYFCKTNETWILLLCGGDKSTQSEDIKQAQLIKEGLK